MQSLLAETSTDFTKSSDARRFGILGFVSLPMLSGPKKEELWSDISIDPLRRGYLGLTSCDGLGGTSSGIDWNDSSLRMVILAGTKIA
jgi:hypothetical protein